MPNTAANKITLFRILLVPVFLALGYAELDIWALVVYIIACISDFADGYIARHYDQASNFGRFADPLADKILVMSALCVFIERGRMSAWVVALVLLREFAVSGLRLLAAEQGRVISAAISGKIKTASTMVCICVMLLWSESHMVDIICSALILVTTLYSGIEYFAVNKDIFSN